MDQLMVPIDIFLYSHRGLLYIIRGNSALVALGVERFIIFLCIN